VKKDLVTLVWTVLENELSAYYINNGPHWARLLRNTDDLSLQASSQQYLDKVHKQLERTWNVTRQPLHPGTSVKHLGMKITRDNNGAITISNPALITNLLAANGLNDCNPSPTPHIVLCAAKDETSVEFMGRMFCCNFLRKSRL
jgi:hypothetical protein